MTTLYQSNDEVAATIRRRDRVRFVDFCFNLVIGVFVVGTSLGIAGSWYWLNQWHWATRLIFGALIGVSIISILLFYSLVIIAGLITRGLILIHEVKDMIRGR
jgi:hypothetical protein